MGLTASRSRPSSNLPPEVSIRRHQCPTTDAGSFRSSTARAHPPVSQAHPASLPSLSVAGTGGYVFLAALGRDSFQVTALAEGVHGVGGQAPRNRPLLDHGPHVRREGALEAGLGIHQVALRLMRR